jgi:hypothetical protein
LTGSIPPSLFEAPVIRIVYLSNNQLDGRIPDTWGQASLLRDLYLDSNQLSGTIPGIQQGQLPNMDELLLQDNDLTGSMPASICANLQLDEGLQDLWVDCEQVVCSCCTQCF